MTPDFADVLSRFDRSYLHLRKAFLELWIALHDLAERSPRPVLVPQVDLAREAERAAGISSLDSALRFIVALHELLGAIDGIEDRDVVAAKTSVRRHAHGLCADIAELDRLVGGENL